MMEVSLPVWPHTVIYSDLLYEDIKSDYIFPEHQVYAFRRCIKMKPQPIDFFDSKDLEVNDRDKEKLSVFDRIY